MINSGHVLEGVSVNDRVKESLCSLSYVMIMDATKDVAALAGDC